MGQILPLPSEEEISFGSELVYGVLRTLIHVVAQTIREDMQDSCAAFQVENMDAQGLGTLRYVAGWIAGKILKSARTYIDKSMFSERETTQRIVCKETAKVEALEAAVIIPYRILCGTTQFPETVTVIEARQSRTHGLIHVTDAFFVFTKHMEQDRVSWLSTSNLKKHRGDLIERTKVGMLSNEELLRA